MNELLHCIFEHFILKCPSQFVNHSLSPSADMLPTLKPEKDGSLPPLLVLYSLFISVTTVIVYYLPVFVPNS